MKNSFQSVLKKQATVLAAVLGTVSSALAQTQPSAQAQTRTQAQPRTPAQPQAQSGAPRSAAPALAAISYCPAPATAEARQTLFAREQRLRRLSLRLRGTDPDERDFNQLCALDVANEAGFFEAKAREYTRSMQYQLMMVSNLEALFRFRQPTNTVASGMVPPRETPAPGGTVPVPRPPERLADGTFSHETTLTTNDRNSFNFLVRRMVSQNRNWDELLVGSEYRAFHTPLGEEQMSDADFLKGIFGSQLPATTGRGVRDSSGPAAVAGGFTDLQANQEQASVLAGAITTRRFFERYATTRVNKNRRRAAAIFRVFLCDDMRPVLEVASGENAPDTGLNQLIEELRQIEASRGGAPARGAMSGGMTPMAQQEAANADAERQHGTNPECMACHYKLDPAARTLLSSGLVASPYATPGALTYRRADGSLLNVPVNSVGELARAISLQPEYAQCQVRHFWSWMIGTNVSIPPRRLQELTREFERVGRRVNDFVVYMTQTPEFRGELPPTATMVTALNVAPILKHCNACHAAEGYIPPFDQVPIGGSRSTHFGYLKDIFKMTDANNNGANKEMPPPRAGWTLTPAQFETLKSWVRTLARDENGDPTITQEEADAILSVQPAARGAR